MTGSSRTSRGMNRKRRRFASFVHDPAARERYRPWMIERLGDVRRVHTFGYLEAIATPSDPHEPALADVLALDALYFPDATLLLAGTLLLLMRRRAA